MSYFEEKKEPYEEGKSPIIEIGDDSDDAKEAVREEDEDEVRNTPKLIRFKEVIELIDFIIIPYRIQRYAMYV